MGDAEQIYVNDVKKYAWRREFTRGVVLLNYEAEESILFALPPGEYRELGSAAPYTQSTTLGPHSAKILAKVP